MSLAPITFPPTDPRLTVSGGTLNQKVTAAGGSSAIVKPFADVAVSFDDGARATQLTMTIDVSAYIHTAPGTGVDRQFGTQVTFIDPLASTDGSSLYGASGTEFVVHGSAFQLTTILHGLQVQMPFAGQEVDASFAIAVTTGQGTAPSTTTASVAETLASSPGTATVTPQAVYRFFDSRFGTHFLTSDTSERDAVIANRPDLVEETNDFGDVVQGSAGSEAVFRLFDNVHGTHFFTSSADELATVRATRSDLIYEPSATFYEHASRQTGDVAVYRLFDTKLGTHFYTGDKGEHDAITTVGAAGYRSDLKDEGISFYAPSGTFK